MKQKTKTAEVLIDSEKENDKEFGDILDALKDGMKVYDKSDYHLDENFLWCTKPDDRWTNFHTRQHIVAKKIERSFPKLKIMQYDEKTGKPILDENGHYIYKEMDNPFAKKAFLLVMMPSNDWAILNRNDKENVILNGILKWGDSAKELIMPKEEQSRGLKPKTLTNFFKKKKKEETIIGE